MGSRFRGKGLKEGINVGTERSNPVQLLSGLSGIGSVGLSVPGPVGVPGFRVGGSFRSGVQPPTGAFGRACAQTPLAREVADIFCRDFVATKNSAMTVIDNSFRRKGLMSGRAGKAL